MMTNPITPPLELVQEWMDEFYGGPGALITTEEAFMAKRAADWGYRKANQDMRRLEARELSVFGLLPTEQEESLDD
jgi:hypothetical protein